MGPHMNCGPILIRQGLLLGVSRVLLEVGIELELAYGDGQDALLVIPVDVGGSTLSRLKSAAATLLAGLAL